MRHLFIIAISFFCVVATAYAQTREYYEIKVYNIASKAQEEKVEGFLKDAYLPALHRAGITKVGVFKPIEGDTVNYGKKVFVLTPFRNLDQFGKLQTTLDNDKQFQSAGKDYLDAPHNEPPYARIESILLYAFSGMPKLEVPKHATATGERIYELRSYEGHTEKRYQNKVKMFNDGDEVGLFKRLGFNAIFYGEVIAGSRMPNLMYMTSFPDRTSRDEHWKAFSADPEWKKLSGLSEYKNNVSKIDIYLLHPAAYSDL
jgi:hypothetical protein